MRGKPRIYAAMVIAAGPQVADALCALAQAQVRPAGP